MGRKHRSLRANALDTIWSTCDKHYISRIYFTPVFTLFYAIQL
jgi:hypothetical protein